MDTEIGYLSQCISAYSKRNFHNQPTILCHEIINLKLGGVNSILFEGRLGLPNGEEMLFLGADVTHPRR